MEKPIPYFFWGGGVTVETITVLKELQRGSQLPQERVPGERLAACFLPVCDYRGKKLQEIQILVCRRRSSALQPKKAGYLQ